MTFLRTKRRRRSASFLPHSLAAAQRHSDGAYLASRVPAVAAPRPRLVDVTPADGLAAPVDRTRDAGAAIWRAQAGHRRSTATATSVFWPAADRRYRRCTVTVISPCVAPVRGRRPSTPVTYLVTTAGSAPIVAVQSAGRRAADADGGLGVAGDRQTFRHSRTLHVVLVRRQGDGGQDADDRNHDHQLDKGETLLDGTLHDENS